MAETKTCKKCGRELPVEAFATHKNTKDGLQPYCRECQKAVVREGRARKKAQAEDAPEEVTPALAGFTDEQLLAELKDRGYFCKDLYKYVKVDFNKI